MKLFKWHALFIGSDNITSRQFVGLFPKLGQVLRKFSSINENELIVQFSRMVDVPPGKSIFDIADQKPSMERSEFQKILESLKVLNSRQRERLMKAIQEINVNEEKSTSTYPTLHTGQVRQPSIGLRQ